MSIAKQPSNEGCGLTLAAQDLQGLDARHHGQGVARQGARLRG